jgi:HK97 family phage prohead protease
MDPIQKAYDAGLDLEAGERTLVCTMTTDAVDRYGEVILPRGIDLTQYRKNPVVLWGHDMSQPPIGRCMWVKPDEAKRALIAKVVFAETEDAEELWRLYKGGFLKAFSIGARPREGSPPTPEEVRKRPEMAECKWVWRKVELTELSAVSVGANPEALATAISKGLALSPVARKRLGVGDVAKAPPAPTEGHEPPAPTTPEPTAPELPPLAGRTFAQAHAELIRSIRTEPAGEIARRMLSDELDRLKGRV